MQCVQWRMAVQSRNFTLESVGHDGIIIINPRLTYLIPATMKSEFLPDGTKPFDFTGIFLDVFMSRLEVTRERK